MPGRREYYTDHPRPILWLIPGGEARIGGEAGVVETVEPFYLSKFPISNLQFEAFDPGFERSPASPGDDDPATGVSWHDAAEYCAWYAEVSRKAMRLPTEVEWEYACRGGESGTWFWGDEAADGDEFAWDAESSGGNLHPLDDKRANGFGLFGMLGGVWEWTGSVYRSEILGREQESAGDAAAEDDDRPRVLRGGSFLTPRAQATCSHRRAQPASSRFPDAGFRIARSLRG